MSNRKNALGRGLSALLEDATPDQGRDLNQPMMAFPTISIEDIDTNPYQPRTIFEKEALEDLSQSIKIQGIIQPITVRRLAGGRYQLISGERRLRASRMAGLTEIPAFIREVDDLAMLEMALVENIQRENLNSLEIAFTFQKLIEECNLTQDALSNKVGKNRSTVTNYLRLLKLPIEIQAGIRDGRITMGHARALVAVVSLDSQMNIYKAIVEKDLSVRQVEEMARNLNEKKKGPLNGKKPQSAVTSKAQSKLSEKLGTKVNIRPGANGDGSIIIHYRDEQHLRLIAEMME